MDDGEEQATALIIVDMQNDFCEAYKSSKGVEWGGGTLAVNDSNQTVPVINKLRAEGNFTFIFRSRDWHPKNHVSFHDNHD